MTATPQRAVRVTDQTWQAAQDRAEREHRTVSDVIQTALRAYAAGRYDAVEPRRRKTE
jgi:hypothetical protein